MNVRRIWIALFCLAICTVGLADTLKLKDGTVLEGSVIQVGDSYRIKMANGETRTVHKNQVAKHTRGNAPTGGTGTAAPGAPGAGGSKPGTPIPSGSGQFQSLKVKADRVDAPLQAVQLWEKYINANPNAADLAAAKGELEKWQQLHKDGAEKIKGKWVGGVERKRIVKQAKNMVTEGVKQIEKGDSQAGFKKIEDALNIYPQSFEANFYLGLQYLRRSTITTARAFDQAELDKAVTILENAAKIAPKSSSTWSNLAIGYAFKKKYKESVQAAYKAAQMHESPDTVQNLIAAFRWAPAGMQQQAWCKEIMKRAVLMADRHNVPVNGEQGGWQYLPPAESDEIPGSSGPAGSVWSGSGFFVTDDGYIITNHHVVTGDAKSPLKPEISFRVRMDDGTEKNAEVVAIDDAADIGILKIVPDKPVVPLKLGNYLPKVGSDLLVLGYPATGDDEHTLQISPGSVKSIHEGDEWEVWMDLNTTHGNSGGPIVDANNHLVAILTAGRESYNMTIVLGVSTAQIKSFFDKIGDKAPKVEWVERPSKFEDFSAETLNESAKVSTVLVIAVRNAE